MLHRYPTARSILVLIYSALCASCSLHSTRETDRDRVTQLSTLGALSSGLYEGLAPVAEMSQYGDLGLGTFDGLDGEMVQIDGQVYQVAFDGTVRKPDRTMTSPFYTTCPRLRKAAQIW